MKYHRIFYYVQIKFHYSTNEIIGWVVGWGRSLVELKVNENQIDRPFTNRTFDSVQGHAEASPVRDVASRGGGAAGGVARLVRARRLPAPAPRRAHAAAAPARRLRQGGGRRAQGDEAGQRGDEDTRGEE